MATLTGLEPATSTVTGWRASDCSTGPMCLVVRGGIDPPASAVSERRSDRLSYRTVVPRAGLEPGSAALKGRLTNPYRNGAWAAWCRRRESNSQPPGLHSGALPTLSYNGGVVRTRFELAPSG